MPCCIEPVGGEIDQETRGDVQTTERKIQGVALGGGNGGGGMTDDDGTGGSGGSCAGASALPLVGGFRCGTCGRTNGGVGKEMSCGWVVLEFPATYKLWWEYH